MTMPTVPLTISPITMRARPATMRVARFRCAMWPAQIVRWRRWTSAARNQFDTRQREWVVATTSSLDDPLRHRRPQTGGAPTVQRRVGPGLVVVTSRAHMSCWGR